MIYVEECLGVIACICVYYFNMNICTCMYMYECICIYIYVCICMYMSICDPTPPNEI